MAVSTIKANAQVIRRVVVPFSAPANGNSHTNLKSYIDADLPSGYEFAGIAGWTSNNNNAVPFAIMYVDNDYSIRFRNVSSTAITDGSANIYYIAKSI